MRIGNEGLAYLREHGETAEAVVADACGCDTIDFNSAMARHLTGGQVAIERRKGIRYWRALNVGESPVRKYGDASEDAPESPPQRAKVEAPASPAPFPAPSPPPSPAALPAPAEPTAPCRFALYNDGSFAIEMADSVVSLSSEEVARMRDFLCRINLGGAA